MKPVSHPSNTRTLAAPSGWDHSGLPVEPLGITDTVIEGVPCVMSFWQLEPEDLACIRAGGLVGLSIVGRTMPPAAVMTVLPPGEAPLEHPEKSPTQGMNLGQRIAHVGGRENAQGYIEFGSVLAVQALIWHVLRDDIQRTASRNAEPAEATKHRIIAEFLESTGHYVTNDASREAAIAAAVKSALRNASLVAAQTQAACPVQLKIIEALNLTTDDGPVSQALSQALDLLDSAAVRPGPVTQSWTHGISMMQQSVLLSAIRGPDGLAKYGGGAKMLIRWLRRCVLLSAMDGKVLADPIEPNGGSFTGPSLEGPDDEDHWTDRMQVHVNDYLRQVDALPHHFQMHFMHAAEILGYKHPTPQIRHFWNSLYLRLVNDFHLWAETEEQMDSRLGDSRSGWLKRADPATVT